MKINKQLKLSNVDNLSSISPIKEGSNSNTKSILKFRKDGDSDINSSSKYE